MRQTVLNLEVAGFRFARSRSNWKEFSFFVSHGWRDGSGNFALSLAIQIRPRAGLDEAGPIIWMTSILIRQHVELRVTERFRSPFAGFKSFVEVNHKVTRSYIADLPQTHDLAFCAR